MIIQLPAKVHIRKVKGVDEGEDSYLLEAEIDIIDTDIISQVMEALAKAAPFDPENDFYPTKFGTPGYTITFTEKGEEKRLSIEGDIICYDSEEDEYGLLPEGEFLMINLLDPLFERVETTKTNILDIYLEIVEETMR
ncbi:MAG: hypothetical protein Q7S53_01940 [bacterium]|nr:hypothetical protein [bacterium]